jgi:hypothetical protein
VSDLIGRGGIFSDSEDIDDQTLHMVIYVILKLNLN